MKQNKLLVSLIASSSYSLVAMSQNTTIESENERANQTEAVVVTGSYLTRTDYEGPQAVVIYDRKRIDLTGARTVTELLAKLPENSTGLSENVYPGFGYTPGASAVSLRGLGATSSLVLINGRRVAPFSFAAGGADTFVDLNSIPLSAVERVEILKEGASAIYGSDAIAGVVNFILRQDYSGDEVETSYGNTTGTDSGEFRESFVSGLNSDRFRLLLTGNYFRRNSLAARDRSYAHTADQRRFGGFDFRGENGNPGTVFLPRGDDEVALAVRRGSKGRPGVDDFKPGFSQSDEPTNPFDGNRYSELVPETERWGGLLTFGYTLTPHLELFGEASYQALHTTTVISPTSLSSGLSGFIVPATNAFNPFGSDLGLAWRSVETRARIDEIEVDAYRYVGGVKVKDLPNNWSAEAAVQYSESNVVDYSSAGYLRQTAVQAALNDRNAETALNVFGDGKGINNPRTLRKITATPRTDGHSSILGYDARANGELFQLPAGPVGLALGAEFREETFTQRLSEGVDDIVGLGAVGSDASRDVYSALFEVAIPVTSAKWNLPLLRALEFSIAERYDHYSDFGGAAKPKFGYKWKPVAGLLFRGAYSEGYRAPSLPQLNSPTITGFGTVLTPGRTRETVVNVLSGGNPGLQPENSYSYFLGAIIEPPSAKGLSLEVNFYRIEHRGLVAAPEAQDVVDGRAPGTVSFGSDGEVRAVTAPYANLGTQVVDGVDLDLTYRFESKLGRLTFDTRASFINSFELRQPGKPNLDKTDSIALPEFRLASSLTYNRGGFDAGVTVNYTDSYDDELPNGRSEPHTVGSWTTVDLQMSYEWRYGSLEDAVPDGKGGGTRRPRALKGWQRLLDGAKLTLGVLNAGNSEPPFANADFGYDPQTADPTGRFLYASLRKKFW